MPEAGTPEAFPVTLAPAVGSSAKSRRSGYLALVASGFITATAFAGIADLASSTVPIAITDPTRVQEFERGEPVQDGGPHLVPGQAYPEHGEVSISGAAVVETFRPRDPSDPTVVVITNPDGTTTTTVLPPPPPGGTTSNGTTPPPPGSTTTGPPGSTTTDPPPSTTDPTTTTEPEPTTTTTDPAPTTTSEENPTSGTSEETSSSSSTSSNSSSAGGDTSTTP